MAIMIRSVLLSLALAGALAAEAPLGSVAVGGYSESVSHGNGIWQGLLLDTTWNPWKNGKFAGSIISFDRPVGHGVEGSLGKYQEFSGGFAFLGVGSSVGADYLPTAQVVTDLDLKLPIPGLLLGGGITYTRVRDGHQDWQGALGPTLYAGNFISTARVALNRSFPGGQDSTTTTVSVRHGTLDDQAWQSLRVSWGGEAYENMLVREAVTDRGAGVEAALFFPLGRTWTLQTELEWGQKFGAYTLWGGSLRVGRQFR